MTKHEIITGSSLSLRSVKNGTVDLIVTSPPYPMIEMWDQVFEKQNPTILPLLEQGKGLEAFRAMHTVLNAVWLECDRVLSQNGFVCINIGDATRKIGDDFQLYSNHAQVIHQFLKMGYHVLPDIHWRKQSNAPNKFMGSGMYPAGAYVTYEHEYILVFRKGGKRVFTGEEKRLRQKSAFFWEERNVWFSDLWDIKGTSQGIAAPKVSRERSASFPLEIPFRLVNMYSIKGDTVLDPFAGLGTTNTACMIANRNSIGFEVDGEIAEIALKNMNQNLRDLNAVMHRRIQAHLTFINALPEEKKEKCYRNLPHGFPVKTRQETAMEMEKLAGMEKTDGGVVCRYEQFVS